MRLYGTPPTRALRPLWLINELDLDCELIPVDITNEESLSEEFLRLNPAKKLPVLVDGDVVLTESAAIPLYLAEKCPERELIPEDTVTRAQMFRWIFFLVTEIEQPLWRIARNTHLYAEEERIPEDMVIARRECIEMCAVFEGHMAGKSFVLGEKMSVADFIAAYTLDWAKDADMLGDCPALRAFVERMYARPKAPPTIAVAFAEMLRRQEAEA